MRLQILPPLFSLKKKKKRKLNFFLFIFNVGDVIFPENGKEKKQEHTSGTAPLFKPFPLSEPEDVLCVCVFLIYRDRGRSRLVFSGVTTPVESTAKKCVC